MEEVWKDIPGYEGAYQASSLGRIRSIDRYATCNGRGGRRLCKGQILKPGRYCKSGHVSVVLGRGTNGKPVHQLVMLTFIGPPPAGMEVRHLNGIPTDNRLENLKYGTRTENILDVFWQGKAWRKVDLDQSRKIKNLLNKGYTASKIAEQMDVSVSSVYAIKRGGTFYWDEQ